MKRTIVLTFALICTLGAMAQKFDREWYTLQNTHLPSKLIYDQVKSYGVSVMTNSSNMYTMDNNFANSLVVTLNSYEKKDYSSADLKVSVTYGPCTFIDETTSSSTREEEVNKQKVKVTYYKRVLNFRFPITYRLVNGRNNVTLYANDFSSGNVRTIETSEFKSEAEAANYLNTNRNTFVANHVNELCQNFMRNSNSSIRDMFDFFPNSTQMEIFQVKKWDKDDEYNAHVKNVIGIFKAQTADEQPEGIREKLKNDIAYFQAFDGVFKADDKKEDILYFVNHYNLATIFFSLDDFEKAKYHLDKLSASDKQEGSTKMLKSYVKSAETRIARHFVANTHLDYNPVADYRLAGKSFASDAASSSENIAASMASGKVEANDKAVMADNKEVTGKIAFIREKGELQMIPKESPDKPIVLTPANCLRFSIDSINYVSVKDKGAGGAPVKQFYQVLYSSDKIKLLEFMTNSFSPNDDFIGFIRPNEEFITYGTGMGVKKRLASYFEDCPAVSEKAKDGDFGSALSKNMTANLKKICEEYDACK